MDRLWIAKRNFIEALDDVQVSPNVTGVELNDPSEFADQSNRISIARIALEPNAAFERHVHPFNHVLVILKGAGVVTYDTGDGIDSVLEFEEGDIFNVPGTNEHAVSANDKGIIMLSIGSPPMNLINPNRMVYVDDELKWMIPLAMDLSEQQAKQKWG